MTGLLVTMNAIGLVLAVVGVAILVVLVWRAARRHDDVEMAQMRKRVEQAEREVVLLTRLIRAYGPHRDRTLTQRVDLDEVGRDATAVLSQVDAKTTAVLPPVRQSEAPTELVFGFEPIRPRTTVRGGKR